MSSISPCSIELNASQSSYLVLGAREIQQFSVFLLLHLPPPPSSSSLPLLFFRTLLPRPLLSPAGRQAPVRVVMSAHDYADPQSESVADAVTAMKLEGPSADVNGGPVKRDPDEPPTITTATAATVNGLSSSGVESANRSPSIKKDEPEDALEEKVGGDITVKIEPGQPPKLARSSSQKVVAHPPRLFLDLPDCTAEAKSTFEILESCNYANKYMGYTEHAMECDCVEEWGKIFLSLDLPEVLRVYAMKPQT